MMLTRGMALARAGGDHTASLASPAALNLARRPGSCVFWLSYMLCSSISWLDSAALCHTLCVVYVCPAYPN